MAAVGKEARQGGRDREAFGKADRRCRLSAASILKSLLNLLPTSQAVISKPLQKSHRILESLVIPVQDADFFIAVVAIKR